MVFLGKDLFSIAFTDWEKVMIYFPKKSIDFHKITECDTFDRFSKLDLIEIVINAGVDYLFYHVLRGRGRGWAHARFSSGTSSNDTISTMLRHYCHFLQAVVVFVFGVFWSFVSYERHVLDDEAKFECSGRLPSSITEA